MLRRRRQHESIHQGSPNRKRSKAWLHRGTKLVPNPVMLTSHQVATTLLLVGLCFILRQSNVIGRFFVLETRLPNHFRFPPGRLGYNNSNRNEDIKDYGNLGIRPLPKHRFRRQIRHDDDATFAEEHIALLEAMDTCGHHADEIREFRHSLEEEDESNPCQPLPWTQETFPSCNLLHEVAQLDRIEAATNVEQLGDGGTFRIGFLYSYNSTSVTDYQDDYVLKALQTDRIIGKEQMSRVNQEALLLDRFSSSDLISNIYGYCGTSVLVERGQDLAKKIIPYMPGQEDDDMRGYISMGEMNALHEQYGGLYRGNEFSPEEKLNMAHDIMSTILLLHEFREGPVVHNDISFDQWLLSMDGRIILNDFNSAVPLKWNLAEQAYCNHATRSGNYKSPEFFQSPLNLGPKADVWPLGCIIYGILAGFYPYHELVDDENDELYMELTKNGIPPPLAPQIRENSFIESRLAEIMDQMFEIDVAKRISINDVVWLLEETRSEYRQKTRRLPHRIARRLRHSHVRVEA